MNRRENLIERINMLSKEESIITPYEKVRGSLKTFDILNCVYGTQPWNPLHWILGAIGHTAMVYRVKETGQLMVYESTQTGRADGLTGVQLRPLKEWLENYPGKVYLRRVTIEGNIFDPGGTATVNDAERACALHIKQHRGTEYPDLKKIKWLWFLANAVVDIPKWVPFKKYFENVPTTVKMFCTHLVGHCFKYCGLVTGPLNAAELQPDDMRPAGQIRYPNNFANYVAAYVKLGAEIRLK